MVFNNNQSLTPNPILYLQTETVETKGDPHKDKQEEERKLYKVIYIVFFNHEFI
jgi:hypothetical protein